LTDSTAAPRPAPASAPATRTSSRAGPGAIQAATSAAPSSVTATAGAATTGADVTGWLRRQPHQASPATRAAAPARLATWEGTTRKFKAMAASSWLEDP